MSVVAVCVCARARARKGAGAIYIYKLSNLVYILFVIHMRHVALHRQLWRSADLLSVCVCVCGRVGHGLGLGW